MAAAHQRHFHGVFSTEAGILSNGNLGRNLEQQEVMVRAGASFTPDLQPRRDSQPPGSFRAPRCNTGTTSAWTQHTWGTAFQCGVPPAASTEDL